MTLRDLLMLTVGMWVGRILTAFFAWWRTRGARRALDESPINVYGEIVLPMPDDLRWQGTAARLRLGTVEVCDGNRLYLAGRQAPHNEITDRYCAAVKAAKRSRELGRLISKVDQTVIGDDELEQPSRGKKR